MDDPAGFEPAIPGIEWLQTHPLDGRASGIGLHILGYKHCRRSNTVSVSVSHSGCQG